MSLYSVQRELDVQVDIELLWLNVKLETVRPLCHRVLAVVLEGTCPACWVGVAAGVANEGSRKTGWKMAGILDQTAKCIAWMAQRFLLLLPI